VTSWSDGELRTMGTACEKRRTSSFRPVEAKDGAWKYGRFSVETHHGLAPLEEREGGGRLLCDWVESINARSGGVRVLRDASHGP